MADDGKISGSGGDLEALEGRLNGLMKRLDDVKAASSSSKMTARLIAVAIVIAALVGVYLLLSPFVTAYKNPQPYEEALVAQLRERVQPELENELRTRVETLGPELGTVVVEKLKSRQQDAMYALDHEIAMLTDNLQAFTEEALADAVVDIEMELKARLRESVPDLDDEEKMELVLGNASIAMESAVQRIVEERLGRHIEALIGIEQQLTQFPVPDTLRQMSETELSDELTRALAEFALLTLRQTFTPETKELLRKLAEDDSSL